MPLANSSWKELSPSPLNGWCGWWNLNRSKLQIFERENWGKPCFSWMRIERLSVHYWGNQRCSMVCLRPSKEHCQFFQEILALKLQYPTKVEKTRLTWSKKQPFGLVKGRIFPDSFCTCCSCYNESHEPKWPETVLFFKELWQQTPKLRSRKTWFAAETTRSCKWECLGSPPALNSWAPLSPQIRCVFSL